MIPLIEITAFAHNLSAALSDWLMREKLNLSEVEGQLLHREVLKLKAEVEEIPFRVRKVRGELK